MVSTVAITDSFEVDIAMLLLPSWKPSCLPPSEGCVVLQAVLMLFNVGSLILKGVDPLEKVTRRR